MAYDIGLQPWNDADAFWNMTPAEFDRTVAAYRKRIDDEWYRTAWMVAWIMRPHIKKKITPEKLLGRKPLKHAQRE